MIKEIFYTKNTLHIFLNDFISKNTTKILKPRLYYIISEYNINNIIINLENVTKIDDSFYDFLDDYDIKFNGNLIVENR